MTDVTHPAPCPGPDAHRTRTGAVSCMGHAKHSNAERQAAGKQPGAPCRKPPIRGLDVCATHGGNSTRARAAGQRRQAEDQARRDVALFGGRRDVDPAQALLELVQWTAGEVDYWRARVREVADTDEDALTWGVTKTKTGGDDHGTTSEAKPNVAYVMLVDASNRLAQYAAAALKAGVEQRRVELAEREGALLAGVIRAILTDLDLSPAQQLLVGEVVPRHLRAIAGGGA